MFKRIILISVLLLTVASSAIAGTINNWELTYEHDGSGNAISGDINKLVSGVKNGADVKVILHSPVSGDVSFVLTRVSVNLANVVFGLENELSSDTTDPNDTTLHQRSVTFATTGQTTFKYYNTPNLNVTLSYVVSWYVSK